VLEEPSLGPHLEVTSDVYECPAFGGYFNLPCGDTHRRLEWKFYTLAELVSMIGENQITSVDV